ncbi:MAG: hypothetical protein HC884_11260, partial [Chloroflexaceae bacterium]|nr:hypothetical protein [Chloroflexaceae bacterium]
MSEKNRFFDPMATECAPWWGWAGLVVTLIALVVGVGLLLVACTPEAAVLPDGLPRGGELRWSIVGVQDLASLDPAHAGEQQSITVMNLVFGGLVRLDEDLMVQPDGAESWQVSEDGRTYTFHIRRNLRFGDDTGTPGDGPRFSVFHQSGTLASDRGVFGS